MRLALRLAPFALCALAGCQSLPSGQMPPSLARTRIASDYPTYSLRRVGLLPFSGAGLDPARAQELQSAFCFELTRRAPYEVVVLDSQQLAEIDPSRPYERGVYSTRTVLETARRFRLDGLLVGTVTHMQSYAPQTLGMQLELVAAETGLVIWSAAVDLDTADAPVRRSIDTYQSLRRDESGEQGDVEVVLLSPASLMRFAAGEVARTLEPR